MIFFFDNIIGQTICPKYSPSTSLFVSSVLLLIPDESDLFPPNQDKRIFFFSSNGYCRNNFSQTVSYYTSTSSVNPHLLSEYTKIILYFLCRLSQDSSAYSFLSFKKKEKRKKSLRVLSDCVTRLRVGGCPPPPPRQNLLLY